MILYERQNAYIRLEMTSLNQVDIIFRVFILQFSPLSRVLISPAWPGQHSPGCGPGEYKALTEIWGGEIWDPGALGI